MKTLDMLLIDSMSYGSMVNWEGATEELFPVAVW